jgi:N-acetylneuraminate synthase
MKINGREISPRHPPYVVAEVGCNHGGSLDRALELIEAAYACGADACKWQCFMPDTLTIDSDRAEFVIADGPWKGRRLYELAKETWTPRDWFPALFEHARKVRITTFASVFDRADVDFLEGLGCPAYKIASFEIVDPPLIRYAAATGKPIILSTGMASSAEIDAAIHAARHTPKAVLICTSGYPTPPSEADLGRLRGSYPGCVIGISDHTTGAEVPIAATALGAAIIEKHFKLTRFPNTQDGPFSMGGVPFAKMVRAVQNTWAALQPSEGESEASSRPLRRSLFAVAAIAKGETFTQANVRSIRPGNGLPPDAIGKIIGHTAACDIERGEPMRWDMVAMPG